MRHRSEHLLVHGMGAEYYPSPRTRAGELGLPVLALATYIVLDPFVVALEVIRRGRLVCCWFLDRDALLAATIPDRPRPRPGWTLAQPTRDLVTIAGPGSDRGDLLGIDRSALRRFLTESTELVAADRETTSDDLDAGLADLLRSPALASPGHDDPCHRHPAHRTRQGPPARTLVDRYGVPCFTRCSCLARFDSR